MCKGCGCAKKCVRDVGVQGEWACKGCEGLQEV